MPRPNRIGLLMLAAAAGLAVGLLGVGHARMTPLAPEPAAVEAGAQVIPDYYVVVLREEVADPNAVANDMAQQYRLSVSHVYEHALKGFAAYISSATLPAVCADSRVLFVGENRRVQALRPMGGPRDAAAPGTSDAAGPGTGDATAPGTSAPASSPVCPPAAP